MIDNFALIIGAMKSGTTSLFSYLAQHPQISACKDKEPMVFTNSHKLEKGFEWYQSLWDWNPDQHKVALEASTSYTRIPARPNAAERISQYQDKASFKFIYIMRNPFDRIESHCNHVQANCRPEDTKVAFENIYSNLILTSQYARQIEEYYKIFPSNNILLLKFEDLKVSPLIFVRTVCQFLDVDPDFEFKEIDKKFNPSEGKIGHNSLLRSMRRKKILRSSVQLLPIRKRQFLSALLGRKAKRAFKLTSEQRNLIFKDLHQDLLKLNSKYGIDVSSWGIEV